MVRRLLQHIVRWIRGFLAQFRSKTPQQPSPTRRQSLMAYQQPQPIHSRELNVAQTQHKHQQNPSFPPLQDTVRPPSLGEPEKPLNPGSPRADNPSNFEILLSPHQRPPSSAVQDLNRQLLHGNTSELLPSHNDAISIFKRFSKAPFPAVAESHAEKNHTSDSQNSSTRIDSPKLQGYPPASASLKERPQLDLPKIHHLDQHNGGNLNQSRIEPADLVDIGSPPKVQSYIQPVATETPTVVTRDKPAKTEQSAPLPVDVSTNNTPVKPITKQPELKLEEPTQVLDTRTITKKGVVKLLFKLKKNNHHGYITPNDGSKDIIFHQKYVGTDVFSQLERGMEVEVEAKIVEGKAYAERICIL
ncbi:MAG: cold shock domain-containing protein [Cyanobacteria bacterium P01_D01_bin.156]